jgi:mannose-1-phosphate guanylyltransferase
MPVGDCAERTTGGVPWQPDDVDSGQLRSVDDEVKAEQLDSSGEKNFHAIIPAGGSGTRLWPLSRRAFPKFLQPLPGPKTMIQETVERLLPLARAEHIYIITGADHAAGIAAQLPALPPAALVIEPAPRGTGPAIGLGVALAARGEPDAIVGSFAADHYVRYPERFREDVSAAIEVAREGYLVTIGIEPEYPETGYGYIHVGDALGTYAGRAAHRVRRFVEKPDLATARGYVESGEYLWNASMFVWRADVLMDEMRALLPEHHRALTAISAAWDTPERDAVLTELWAGLADVTIDHGILEHSQRVAVVPSSMGWTDLGDWHSVGSIRAGRGDVTVVAGAEVIEIGGGANIVDAAGRLVALVGVENLIVIDTGDALLVCDRSRAQDVKAVVDRLRAEGRTELL